MIYTPHRFILILCLTVAFGVVNIMVYALIKHRKTMRGDPVHHFHARLPVELFWTVVPLVMMIALIVPTLKILWLS